MNRNLKTKRIAVALLMAVMMMAQWVMPSGSIAVFAAENGAQDAPVQTILP